MHQHRFLKADIVLQQSREQPFSHLSIMLWVEQTLDQYLASSHMKLCVFVTFSLKCLCRESLNQAADKQTAEQMEERVWISAPPWFTGCLQQISLSAVSLVGIGVGRWRPVASETVICTDRWAVRDLFWSDNWYQMVYEAEFMHVDVHKVCREKEKLQMKTFIFCQHQAPKTAVPQMSIRG